MNDWAPRRFWKETSVYKEDAGFGVRLDERPLRTPAKAVQLAPTQALADAIAKEWDAQEEVVDPASMPFTRSLNAALDKVAPNPEPVIAMLAEYAETDLLCYRAKGPQALIARQAQIWDPYLDWAGTEFGAQLQTTAGVMPVVQSQDALAKFRAVLGELDPYELTAIHDLITLSGSLVLGLAALMGRSDGDTIWQASRLDELWQIEHWGEDEEAELMSNAKKDAFLHALAFQALARADA